RQLAENTFQVLSAEDCADLRASVGKDILVPLDCWLTCQDTLSAREGRTGVWLDSNEFPEKLGDTLAQLDIIGLNFPVFKDGRPFTSARELRMNRGYKGELRAIGDVLRDQLFYMWRCGFDAFLLREDQDIDEALRAFNDF